MISHINHLATSFTFISFVHISRDINRTTYEIGQWALGLDDNIRMMEKVPSAAMYSYLSDLP